MTVSQVVVKEHLRTVITLLVAAKRLHATAAAQFRMSNPNDEYGYHFWLQQQPSTKRSLANMYLAIPATSVVPGKDISRPRYKK